MMKRTITSFAVAAAALLFVAGAAQSATTIDLIWRTNGTDTIDPFGLVGPADTPDATVAGGSIGVGYNLDVVLRNTGSAVTGVFISFLFDTDLGNELDFFSGNELSSVLISKGNSFAPIGQGVVLISESSAGTPGLVIRFDQATLGTGLETGTVTLGSLVFLPNSPGNSVDDGIDVTAAVLPNGTDAIIGGDGSLTINGASVTGPPVPEPTTALLVVLGLAGLGFAGRRNIG